MGVGGSSLIAPSSTNLFFFFYASLGIEAADLDQSGCFGENSPPTFVDVHPRDMKISKSA
jgi:hypothetical protein